MVNRLFGISLLTTLLGCAGYKPAVASEPHTAVSPMAESQNPGLDVPAEAPRDLAEQAEQPQGEGVSSYTLPELAFHESLTGVSRDAEFLARLRERRLKVDSASNGGGACQYGSLLGAGQEYAGVNLTQEHLAQLREELGKKGPSGRPAVNFNTYEVIGSEAVVQAALKLLTNRDFQVIIRRDHEASEALKNQAQYTMRIIQGHRNLGDQHGAFLWESLEYNREASVKTGRASSLRYIVITPGN
ncbi:MAG: hypothetical protein LBD37_10640 [Treponema sp.]|nr:hypothetical protein [Treponema sp.]